MTKPRPGIGRGLEAILSASTVEDGARGEDLRELAVDVIAPNPRQPRTRFDEGAMQALARSVGEHGLVQPVLVRPKPGGTYELVAGERRWRAARLAGLERIPAIVRSHAEAEALELALVENMAREDLTPIEQARACAALIEELGLTREDVGRRVGRSRVAVSNLVRLLDLPEEVIGLLQEGTLSEGHGRALLLAEDHATRRTLARTAVQHGWSVRTVEGRARASNDASEPLNGSRRRAAGSVSLHPDREDAAGAIAESLAETLGADVKVRALARGGYRAELHFESVDEALALARRLNGHAVETGETPHPIAAFSRR